MVPHQDAECVSPHAPGSYVSVRSRADETRDVCLARLTDPEMREVARRIERRGITPHAARALVHAVDERSESRAAILDIKSSLVDALPLERWLLINAAVDALSAVPRLRVPRGVADLLCEHFRFLAGFDDATRFDARRSAFVDMAKKATLRRFPAGQFDWERSGVPRSYLVRVRAASRWRVAWFVVSRMRRLRPVFFSHLNPMRKQTALSEREALRSYALMAEAMRLQADVRGFAACSWFRSPDTHAVSPHLAWLSDVFLSNGGIVVAAGPADPDCGVFHRSATRLRMYQAGRFKPTEGLVMWPRAAMLTWAAAHRDLLS